MRKKNVAKGGSLAPSGVSGYREGTRTGECAMLAAASKPLVRLFDRYLPDPYIFVLILTLVVFAAAIGIEGQSPLAVVTMWGDGFWALLEFSMQMVLVLVGGHMLASTPPVKRLLVALARIARSPGGAILLVSYVALVACWINWGFGLVVGALLPRRSRARFGSTTACWWPAPIPASSSGTAAWLIALATPETFPFWTFMSAGIVNFFVPSGGGQWAVQAPVILPAAEALGVDTARAAMAIAWGDAWTNLIQPFWALPILAIAGLNAKDIMGSAP
jgi:short subunit fatty acids transporter